MAVSVDRVFGGVACALAVAFLIFVVPTISDDWQRAAGAQYFTVGPRLFPYVAGSLCLVFGALIALWPGAATPAAFLRDARARRQVLLLALLTVGYAASLGVLGFVLSSMLAMALFMVGFGVRRWGIVLPVALLLPLLTDLAFARVLQLRLPPGLLDLPAM